MSAASASESPALAAPIHELNAAVVLTFKRSGDLSWREFLRTVIDPRRKDYAVLSLRDPGTFVGYPVNTLWKYLAFIRGNRGEGS